MGLVPKQNPTEVRPSCHTQPGSGQYASSEIKEVMGEDVCLIFHLLYPDKNSLNHHTPEELGTVKCKDFDEAVRMCLAAGPNAFMAKSDLKSAFRHLPVRKEDWCWLVMKATDPATGIQYFFCDKNVPSGAWVYVG